MKAEWCGKPLPETRCALAPGHDGLCCTSMEASLVAKCESLRSSLRAAEERAAEGDRAFDVMRARYIGATQNLAAAERRAEGLEEDRERLLHLLADVWAQFSCPVPKHPGVAHDGGLSTLEDVQIALEAAGRMETAGVAGRDWWRASPDAGDKGDDQ